MQLSQASQLHPVGRLLSAQCSTATLVLHNSFDARGALCAGPLSPKVTFMAVNCLAHCVRYDHRRALQV